jgi:hypothetical protein
MTTLAASCFREQQKAPLNEHHEGFLNEKLEKWCACARRKIIDEKSRSYAMVEKKKKCFQPASLGAFPVRHLLLSQTLTRRFPSARAFTARWKMIQRIPRAHEKLHSSFCLLLNANERHLIPLRLNALLRLHLFFS